MQRHSRDHIRAMRLKYITKRQRIGRVIWRIRPEYGGLTPFSWWMQPNRLNKYNFTCDCANHRGAKLWEEPEHAKKIVAKAPRWSDWEDH